MYLFNAKIPCNFSTKSLRRSFGKFSAWISDFFPEVLNAFRNVKLLVFRSIIFGSQYRERIPRTLHQYFLDPNLLRESRMHNFIRYNIPSDEIEMTYQYILVYMYVICNCICLPRSFNCYIVCMIIIITVESSSKSCLCNFNN